MNVDHRHTASRSTNNVHYAVPRSIGIRMQISQEFDGGNIRCLDCRDIANVSLEIRNDNQSEFYQWFYFRATGVKGESCTFVINNAAGAAYAEGWAGYNVVASYDREIWFRVPTNYDGGLLKFDHQPIHDAVYYAYFAPYTMERHADLIADALQAERCQHILLGQTLDGQDMDLLVIGEPDAGKRKCWVIARQHPGETMAEWWMEGFLGRLLDADDPVARTLLNQTVFYVVPNMNPDGSRRGHLRTNAAGANLNREWAEPSDERSPEVRLVRQAMHDIGVDFCLDVHGDEALPYNFIAGAEGIEGWSDRLEGLTEHFKAEYQRVNPDFQTVHGYDRDQPESSDLRKCTDYVAQAFDCLSMTLEMPFKDNLNAPDAEYGWSPERCRILGRSVLDPVLSVLPGLR